MMTEEEFRQLQFAVESEGLDYCFLHYSDWSEIKDKKLHKLRDAYAKAAQNMRDYLEELTEKYGEYGEDE